MGMVAKRNTSAANSGSWIEVSLCANYVYIGGQATHSNQDVYTLAQLSYQHYHSLSIDSAK